MYTGTSNKIKLRYRGVEKKSPYFVLLVIDFVLLVKNFVLLVINFVRLVINFGSFGNSK